MTATRARLVPHRPLPPYAFTGDGFGHPHPRNHPEGHSRDAHEIVPPALEPARWSDSEAYLFGIDLFNHGYYWESHEEWEGVWNAAGRSGPVAELMKGLIKLAAAGVKARQGRIDGLRRHGARAAQHFERTFELVGARRFCGLDLESLAAFGRELAATDGARAEDGGLDVVIVFERRLWPDDGDRADEGSASS